MILPILANQAGEGVSSGSLTDGSVTCLPATTSIREVPYIAGEANSKLTLPIACNGATVPSALSNMNPGVAELA